MAGSPEQSPLIREALAKRQQRPTHEQSIERARRLVPDFRKRIDSLLQEHFPKLDIDEPEPEIPVRSLFQQRSYDELKHDSHEKAKANQGVLLECIIPVAHDSIRVEVMSSQYPMRNKGRIRLYRPNNYLVSVEELDEQLVLRGDTAVIQEKIEKTIFAPPSAYASPTDDERDAGLEDLQKYKELFDTMQKTETTYIPHTQDSLISGKSQRRRQR